MHRFILEAIEMQGAPSTRTTNPIISLSEISGCQEVSKKMTELERDWLKIENFDDFYGGIIGMSGQIEEFPYGMLLDNENVEYYFSKYAEASDVFISDEVLRDDVKDRFESICTSLRAGDLEKADAISHSIAVDVDMLLPPAQRILNPPQK